MNYVKTMIAAIALMTSVFQTGCIEEELTRPRAEEAGGAEAPDAPGVGDGAQPGDEAPHGEGPENMPGDGLVSGASPGDPGEGDEDEEAPGSPVCLGLDGEVAHECDEGFRCVEFCANDCEGEVCPQICRIEYRCEADAQPAPDAPGDVENPIGDGEEPNEGGEADEGADGGVVVAPIEDGDDGAHEEGEPGVIGGEPGAGDDEDDEQVDAAVCLAPDGDIALECEAGFKCVENVVSPCEDFDGEEMCSLIGLIEYECQALCDKTF